jgi:hypothetical protein
MLFLSFSLLLSDFIIYVFVVYVTHFFCRNCKSNDDIGTVQKVCTSLCRSSYEDKEHGNDFEVEKLRIFTFKCFMGELLTGEARSLRVFSLSSE